MQFGRFRLGMRTFKSGMAVMICLLLAQVFTQINPMIASLSAVFSLRQNLTTSVSFGKSRVIGNSIGGALAILYLWLMKVTGIPEWTQIIIIPFLVIFCISFSVGIKNEAGVIAGIATLLLIVFTMGTDDGLFFGFLRVVDTFIGMIVAVLLNIYVRPPVKEEITEINEDIQLLEKKELELIELRKKIEEKKKLETHKENQT
jgi:uncharacterized membrane protein YgaE (UPF0421/DUF939 family)